MHLDGSIHVTAQYISDSYHPFFCGKIFVLSTFRCLQIREVHHYMLDIFLLESMHFPKSMRFSKKIRSIGILKIERHEIGNFSWLLG